MAKNIIKQYSEKLSKEVGKKYNYSTLFKIRKVYEVFGNEKVAQLAPVLSWSHYIELIPIKDVNKRNYYLNISINNYLSRNDLRNKIKSKEYERLDDATKEKIIHNEKTNLIDLIPNPIIIKNEHNKTIGIIICKKDNKYIIEYTSDKRIVTKEYLLI